MILNEKAKRRIIPIASGKGGAGKSFFCANLGMMLAAHGQRTVLVDLDLGGSNLHSYLGVRNTNRGIGNFLSDSKLSVSDLAVRTKVPELDFVPGDVLVAGLADLQANQKKRIAAGIQELEADYVLLDLGSGSSATVIDFFLMSDSGIVVATPQAPSILNAYAFLKNTEFRFIQRSLTENKKVARFLRDVVKEATPGSGLAMDAVISGIRKISRSAANSARKNVKLLQPKLTINMAEAAEDIGMAESLRDLVANKLSIHLDCLGMIFFDSAARASTTNLEPFALHHQESIVHRQLDRIAQKIIASESYPNMPFDFSEYSDSYELAEIEARNDIEDVQSGEYQLAGREQSLPQEEYLSVIAAQRQKINELEGTVRMLTMQQEGPPDRG